MALEPSAACTTSRTLITSSGRGSLRGGVADRPRCGGPCRARAGPCRDRSTGTCASCRGGLAVLRARLREARGAHPGGQERARPLASCALARVRARPETVEIATFARQLGAGADRLADQRLAAGLGAGRAACARRARAGAAPAETATPPRRDDAAPAAAARRPSAATAAAAADQVQHAGQRAHPDRRDERAQAARASPSGRRGTRGRRAALRGGAARARTGGGARRGRSAGRRGSRRSRRRAPRRPRPARCARA